MKEINKPITIENFTSHFPLKNSKPDKFNEGIKPIEMFNAANKPFEKFNASINSIEKFYPAINPIEKLNTAINPLEQLNTGINPFLNHIQRSNLSLVFKSPLINKEKERKVKVSNNKVSSFIIEHQNPNNIFKEKETLKKIFSNQIDIQRKNNNNLDIKLEYNTNVPYLEDLIFVKDKVQISNSLTTLTYAPPLAFSPEQGEEAKAGDCDNIKGINFFQYRFPLGRRTEGHWQMQIEKKDYYQLTLNINNYLYILSKLVMTSLNYKPFIWKGTLFRPKSLLVQHPNVNSEIMQSSLEKTQDQIVILRFIMDILTSNHTPKTEEEEVTVYGNGEAYGEGEKEKEKAVELELVELELQAKRNKKVAILQKKLITNLLKEGFNLILNLNIFINHKKMDIKNLINLNPALGLVGARKNPTESNIEPALFETKIFKSKLEFELNILEIYYLESLLTPPYGVGVENVLPIVTQSLSHSQNQALPNPQRERGSDSLTTAYPLPRPLLTYGGQGQGGGKETLQDKNQEQELVKENSRNISKNSINNCMNKETIEAKEKEKEKEKSKGSISVSAVAVSDFKTKAKEDFKEKDKGSISDSIRTTLKKEIVVGQGHSPSPRGKIKNEIFIPIEDKLEFETPELTNLPFSLLFYINDKNKNNITLPSPLPLLSVGQSRTGQGVGQSSTGQGLGGLGSWKGKAENVAIAGGASGGYNNNLQLKTVPFSLLLDKNTVLEGKNAVKLSIVTSHFDLDKNNTRDTVQSSALSSTASLAFATGSSFFEGQGGKEKENLVEKPVISQYLKELSIYNIRNKGIIIFYYILIGFHFNTDLNKSFTSASAPGHGQGGKKTKNINKLLAASFKSMYCLISKPVFITTPDKIIVQLFYYLFIPNVLKLKKFFNFKDKDKDNKVINTYFNREPIVKSKNNVPTRTLKSSKSQIIAISKLRKKQNKIALRKKKIRKQYNKFRKIKINVRVKLRKLSNISLVKVFPNKFKLLSLNLNNIFKKPVVFDLVRIHYPYNDSNILVNLLGIMINKIKLRIIIRRFFEKAIIKNINKFKEKRGMIIPSFLSGLTIRVAGRLLTHKFVPRLTVKSTNRGASASGRINFKDIATYTNKNKRGAYSITVKAGQNLF